MPLISIVSVNSSKVAKRAEDIELRRWESLPHCEGVLQSKSKAWVYKIGAETKANTERRSVKEDERAVELLRVD
jgi:hypothetical protein